MHKTKEKWISSGLEILSKQEEFDISIEKIASKSKLPRSGFYYYFEDKEEFKTEMIEYMLNRIKKIQSSVGPLNNYKEYAEYLIGNFSNELMVMRKLLTDQDTYLFRYILRKIQKAGIFSVAAELWAKHYNIPEIKKEDLVELYRMNNEKFFSRIKKDMTVDEFLKIEDEIYLELRTVLKYIANKK